MFQFRRFPSYTYLIQCRMTGYCPAGLPHSEICGSKDICSSPQLIAACHVLLRLLMPRHSPCALFSLTWRRRKVRLTPVPPDGKTCVRSLAPPLPPAPACAGLPAGRGRLRRPFSGDVKSASSTPNRVGAGGAYFSRSEITWATFTPDAPAWARPRVTPAPSPTAKKPGRAVSSSLDRASRAE